MQFFLIYFYSNFFHKTKYVEQSSWRRDNRVGWWMGQTHHCDLGLWRGKCHIFLRLGTRLIWCGYFWLSEDLLYIPLTLYVRIENVMDKEDVFITRYHNGTNVKYLPCAFEGIYVLDVSNLLKDLLYEDISKKFHVYDTWLFWHNMAFVNFQLNS
jgi:hypothetical protein